MNCSIPHYAGQLSIRHLNSNWSTAIQHSPLAAELSQISCTHTPIPRANCLPLQRSTPTIPILVFTTRARDPNLAPHGPSTNC